MSVCTSLSDEVLVRRLVELTEAGLPLVADPWAWLADELGLAVDDTLALLQRLQAEGAIRRIAAVPNHYRLGYRAQRHDRVDVDDAEIDRLGALIGAQPLSATAIDGHAARAGLTTCSPWCTGAMPATSRPTATRSARCSAVPVARTRCWCPVAS